MNLNFLKSAFDKIGGQSKQLEEIAASSQMTAAAVTAGGVLYTKVDEMVVLLRQIAENGMGSKTEALKDAKVLGLVGKAMEPLGKGFQLLVAALNELPDGEEATKKMDALVGGLVKLKDVGSSILQFAGYMALAAPLLLLAAIASPFLLLSLFAVTKGLEMVSNRVDSESIEKFKMLGDVGKSILLLGGSLALFGLIGPLAVKGALFAGISLLIVGGTFRLLDVMGLDPETFKQNAETLSDVGIGLLALGGSLALIGVFSALVFRGAVIAGLAITIIGGAFWFLEKMKVTDKIEKGAKSLSYVALSILALGASFALFEMIAPPVEKILEIGMIVAGTAVAFGIVGIFGDTILKGAKAMGFVALSILALGLSLYLFDMLVPGDILSMETLKAFIVVGALGVGFAIAGKAATTIAQGAGAMLVAGLALIVIGAGVYVLNSALPTENAWERIGQMGAIIAGLGVAMALAGASGGLVVFGALQMLVAGVALIPIAMGIAALNAAIPDENPWERIGLMGAVIGGIALAMTGAGALSPLILVGSAAMIVAGVALLTIGAGIAVLSALDWPKMMGKGGVFGDSGQTGFFGGVKSNLEVALDAIADGISINPITLAGMLMGAPAFILAGVALLTIGAGISKFQKIAEKADLPTLGANIDMIVTALSDSFARIGTLYPGGGASIFGGGSVVAQGISATLGMGRALTGIARGMQAMANLQFPVEFDKEGNPIKFESMNSDAPMKVAANAAMITSVLGNVFGEIGTKYPGGKAGLFSSIFGSGKQSPVADGISAVMGMGDALTGIAKGFQSMANLNFPVEWDKDGKPTKFENIDIKSSLPLVMANTWAIVTGLSSVFAQIGKNPDAQSNGWFGKSTIQKGIDVVAGIGEPLFNLAKGVQDIANLKFPTGFDKDGKATGYETITSPSDLVARVGSNTALLIEALVSTFTQIGGGPAGDRDDLWFWEDNAFEKGVKIVSQIAEPYHKLSSSIKDVVEVVGNMDTKAFAGKMIDLVKVFVDAGQMSDPAMGILMMRAMGSTFEKLGSAVPAVVQALGSLNMETSAAFRGVFFGAVDPKDPSKSYSTQGVAWEKIGVAMPSIASNMQVTAGAINAMDLEKLTEARTMFEALATLTHGGDASTILSQMGESLEMALQNLATMLSEFKDTVGEAAAGQTEATGMLSGAVNDVKDVVAGVTGGATADTPAAGDEAAQKPPIDVSNVVRAIESLQNLLTAQGIKVRTI